MILDSEQQRQIIGRALAGLTIGQLGPNSGLVAETLAAVQAAEITPSPSVADLSGKEVV